MHAIDLLFAGMARSYINRHIFSIGLRDLLVRFVQALARLHARIWS